MNFRKIINHNIRLLQEKSYLCTLKKRKTNKKIYISKK